MSRSVWSGSIFSICSINGLGSPLARLVVIGHHELANRIPFSSMTLQGSHSGRKHSESARGNLIACDFVKQFQAESVVFVPSLFRSKIYPPNDASNCP